MNSEARITKNFINLLIKKYTHHIWLYKIPDVWNSLKPFDVIWCYKWKWLSFEFKYINKLECDYKNVLSLVQWNQILNLKKFAISWWLSYIVVYNKATKKYFIHNINNGGEQITDRNKIDNIFW